MHTPNRSGFPIIEVPLARDGDIDAVGRFLFDNGIYVTLAAYPLVPRNEVGFRIQMTAANTDAEIEQLLDVLGRLANRFDLQPARTEASGRREHPLRQGSARESVALVPRGHERADRALPLLRRRSPATGR